MKKENNKNNNQNQSTQIIATVLAIAILIVAVVGISFAAFTYTKTGEKENTITTGSITMTYTEGDKFIDITDAFPISDTVGKAFTADSLGSDTKAGKLNSENPNAAGVFDFNVSAQITGSASINYDVIATKQGGSDLPDSAVKLYLQKATDAEYSSPSDERTPTLFSALPEVSTGASTDAGKGLGATSKVLTTGTFASNTTNYYRLKMWVDEDYGSDDATGATFKDAKTFKVKVDVYGQAGAGA